jgi:hypothetical protein
VTTDVVAERAVVYIEAMRIGVLLAGLGCALGLSCATSSDDGSRSGNHGTGGAGQTGGGTSSGGSTGSGGASGTGGNTGTGGATTGDGGSTGTGGTMGDGGSSGSGGAVTDPDSGSPGTGGSSGVGQGCVGVTAAFCDDFEQQTEGKAPQGDFTVNTSGSGTLLVETTKPYSGAKSAHIHVPKGAGGSNDPTAQMTFTKQFPIAANDVHGRVVLFLTKNPNGTNNPNIHWDLTWTSAGNKQYVLGSMYNDVAKAGAFMPVYQPPDDSIDTSTPFPESKWACIQWEFRYGGAGGDLLEIKMDGTVVDLGTSTAAGDPINGGHIAKWPAGAWTNLVFGYVHYSRPTPIDVDLWFDDLAFGPQEIPCPPAK